MQLLAVGDDSDSDSDEKPKRALILRAQPDAENGTLLIVGEDLADLIIGYYGASAAINRLCQLGDEALRSVALRALGRLVVASYLEDAARLHHRLRPVLFSSPHARPVGDSIARQMQDLILPFDPVKEVHVLTDDLLDHGHYRFE